VVAASAIVGLLGCEGEVLSKTIIPMIDYFTIAGLIGIVFVRTKCVRQLMRVNAGDRMTGQDWSSAD
jgi:hypothetical protein